MASLPERQNKRGWCTSCGAWWKDVFTLPDVPETGDPAYRFYVDSTYPLCEDCIRRWYESGTIVMRFTEPIAGRPAETSRELFKAARVLLKAHVTDEAQIIPTLLAAHAIDRGAFEKEWYRAATEQEIIRKDLKHLPRTNNLRVVKEVEGVLILEWEPIVAQLVWEPIFSGPVWEGTSQQLELRSWKKDGSEPLTRRWRSGPPWSESPTDQGRPDRAGVLFRVYPYKERIQRQVVAARYEEVLAAAGLPCGRPRDALAERELIGPCLCLLVASGKRRSGRRTVTFPSPRFVEAFSEAVLTEFEDHLVMRKAGRSMDPDNLIPACVGFLLRATGRMEDRKEVERLLDEHVFCEMPWKALDSEDDLRKRKSKKQYFWDSIKESVHPKIELLLNDHQIF